VEGLLGELKEWSPLVTVLGVGITIFLLGWRFPSKADVNRGDDNLQKQINQGIDLTLAVTKEIREDMRQMRSEIVKLADKVDANSQVFQTEIAEFTGNFHSEIAKLTGNFHTEIAKFTDKIEVNTHTIHERIDERTREIRSEIRELNKDYKAHLLQHAEKK
jgi:gas vesicle protein